MGLAVAAFVVSAIVWALLATVTTQPATSVIAVSALLHGSANPNGEATTGWFRIDTSDPGTCNDSFGTRVPGSSGASLGSGSSDVPYSALAAGLLPGTTYYFCAIASNGSGTAFGGVLSFATPALAPAASTFGVSSLTGTSVTLNGTANPRGDAATGYFRYGTTNPGTCSDAFGTRAPSSGGAALGSGNAAVAFSQGLTGLSPGTTYYFCAAATNSIGTGFGAVASFTTITAPGVYTVAQSNVTTTGATLGGSAYPNGDATTGFFRYGTTNPGVCTDTFGTRAPPSGGTALGSGIAIVSFNQDVTGLTPNTTYYYCAGATNSVGTTFGTVMSFTTLAAPTVTTDAATNVLASSVTLNMTVTPNGAQTYAWFRYGTTNPGTCNDAFGTRIPLSPGASMGQYFTPISYAQGVVSLVPGTTYYYCAIASNSVGTTFGAVMTFTTSALAPTATTSAATLVTGTTATLNGSANPRGASTTGYFRYGTTNPGTCTAGFGNPVPSSGGTDLGAGNTAVGFTEPLTGLAPGTTYYYCAAATNTVGTGFGTVMSFTTANSPIVTTNAATSIATSSATLNGSANPRGAAGSAWFRYDTVDPGTCNDTFGTRAPNAGGSALSAVNFTVSFSQAVNSLLPGTTYYYCAIATNSVGTTFGNVLSFSTPAPPTVTTLAATNLTATSVTLNGSAIPNGVASTGWFRYGTTNPGTCTSSFGTRAPATSGTPLNLGFSPVPYSYALSGLTPGTTYYYCAGANNALGTSFGAVVSFTTPAAAPTVFTDPVLSPSNTTATLPGTGNPNGDATIGYFRYGTTNPGTCSDTFGTRAPNAGGTALGSGLSPVSFNTPLTGLTPDTTYYYCAAATNSVGTSFGNVSSFRTADVPVVTTSSYLNLASTSVQLSGNAIPKNSSATGWFRFGTTNPGTCNDSFGTRAPASGGSSLGSGSAAVPFYQYLFGLTPSTTYYYCAIASNAIGTGFGSVLSFKTSPAAATPPIVTTSGATGAIGATADLNGTVNPNGQSTTAWFRYSSTDPGFCDDTFGTRVPASGGTAVGSGNAPVGYWYTVNSFVPGGTYYYCAIAQNSSGTTVGAVVSFTTDALAPAVVTQASTTETDGSTTLHGLVTPNGAPTIAGFRYGTTDPGTCSASFGTAVPSAGVAVGSGNTGVPVTHNLTSLSPGTYYYCAVATNSAGTVYGSVVSFDVGGDGGTDGGDAGDAAADSGSDTGAGSGGSTGAGGTAANGGASATGGGGGAGGTSSTGGTSGSGGADGGVASGGTGPNLDAGNGGAVTTDGSTGTGGLGSTNDGSTSTGGASSGTGGASTGTGGAVGSGAAPGTGGSGNTGGHNGSTGGAPGEPDGGIGDGGDDPGANSGDTGGCGCSLASRANASWPALFVLALLALRRRGGRGQSSGP